MKAWQMAAHIAKAALLAGHLLALTPIAAGAAEQAGAMQQSCWTPAQLAGHPQERFAQQQRQPLPLPLTAPAAVPSSIVGNVRRVKLPPGKKLIALTFDMCEAAWEIAGYDGGVIDYLRANKVKATLFVGGKWMIHHGERAEQLLADPLFETGTHGWSHANLHTMSGQAIDDEIFAAVSAYKVARRDLSTLECTKESAELERIPASPKLFRFPFGTCNPEALASVARSGQLAIQWDVVTGDPDKHITAQGIAQAVLAETRPGSIIVAHANGRGAHTAEALPLFVPQLRAKGFEFVTVSELLAAGTPEIASTCYERRPGDNARYDVVAARLPKGLRRQGAAPQQPGLVPFTGGPAAAPQSPAPDQPPAPVLRKPPAQTGGVHEDRWP
jgi:peptidoglycan/xylan/chitin deacetylase (PgdA/CDA1 family)